VPSHLKPLVATAIGCIALGVPSTTSAAGLACGAVIVKSTTLRNDLRNCPGNGLVIGADNLTLDLGGHTIDGTGTAGNVGILLFEHDGVTITRGTVKEFETGVGLGRSDSNRLNLLVVTASIGPGIAVLESNDNVVSHVNSSGNANRGILAYAADRNRIVDSTFADNPVAGVEVLEGSNHNRITGNRVTGSGEVGIGIDRSDDNLIADNRADDNVNGIGYNSNGTQIVDNLITDTIGCDDGCGAGIDGSGGSDVLIEGNRISGTRREGIRLNEFEVVGGSPVTGNIVRRNVVRDAGTDGIALQTYTDDVSGHGTLAGNRVEENLVSGSDHDGINIGRPANTVTRNLALHNHALGIEAVQGAIDGGGNLAFGNGDPRQCLRIACR
jgi:parallel beta-helix repeat protein